MSGEIIEQLSQEEVDVVPYYHIIATNIRAGLPPNLEFKDSEDCRLQFEGVAATLIYGRPGEPGVGEAVNIYVSKAHIQIAVIEDDDDILSSAEVKQR